MEGNEEAAQGVARVARSFLHFFRSCVPKRRRMTNGLKLKPQLNASPSSSPPRPLANHPRIIDHPTPQRPLWRNWQTQGT